jgi:CRISPR-associated protein Cas8c/Csd1, subtype I-C/DVULG
MILQALCDYYDRMAEEFPEEVAQPGYAVTSVSKSIVLDKEGHLVQVLDLTEWREICNKNGKTESKAFPMRLVTPQQPKRSGKKPEPAFLCENANFLFGIYSDPEGADYRFEASRSIHETVLHQVQDDGAKAVLSFFARRKKGSLDYGDIDTSGLEEGGNIVFQLESDLGAFIHDRPAIKEAWDHYLSARSENATIGQCLVTGTIGPIARIHGNLDGFGQDKPTLVGFNKDSFVSYRKEKGDNAPVSESAAFKYVTALNMLIGDRSRCLNIHGEKVLFWAEKKAPMEEQIVGAILEGETSFRRFEIDELTSRKVSGVLDHLLQGTPPEQLELSSDVRIFVLGLTSNKTRLVIRYFFVNTFGQFVERLQRHHEDIKVIGSVRDPVNPSVYRIMKETALRGDSKNVPAPHQTALIRSIMTGSPYPNSLYIAMLGRIRAEAGRDAVMAVNRVRIGVIKGYLNRNARLFNQKEWLGVALDSEITEVPYLLGRLFAILNQAQYEALGKVNASIVDKYLNAALASPQQVFPSLLSNAEKHFKKSEKHFVRKQMMSVMEKLPTGGFPKTLNVDAQGQFMIGFYHQQQFFFRGKPTESGTEVGTEPELVQAVGESEASKIGRKSEL